MGGFSLTGFNFKQNGLLGEKGRKAIHLFFCLYNQINGKSFPSPSIYQLNKKLHFSSPLFCSYQRKNQYHWLCFCYVGSWCGQLLVSMLFSIFRCLVFSLLLSLMSGEQKQRTKLLHLPCRFLFVYYMVIIFLFLTSFLFSIFTIISPETSWYLACKFSSQSNKIII